jgi:hypothetical protein
MRRRYEVRYLGGGRWYLRGRRPGVSVLVWVPAVAVVAGGAVREVWHRVASYATGPQAVVGLGAVVVLCLWVVTVGDRP